MFSLDLLEKVTSSFKNHSELGRSMRDVDLVCKNRPKRQLSSERFRGPSGIDSSQYVLSPIGCSTLKKKRKLDSLSQHDSGHSDEGANGTDVSSSAEVAGAADSSEQRWCICNEYSYGNMIACDSRDCPIEWFHYPCVGIPPSGITKKKWYCPNCRVKLKKKNSSNKKN